MNDEALVARARALMVGGRALLGICGAPGSGKSTLAAGLVASIGEAAVVVPLDGFHLHDDELARLGRSGHKGAPDTFDVAGYAALLRRLRTETEDTVYAPEFDRSRELSVAGAIAVRPEHRLVVTEGNYLLHDGPGWRDLLPLLDEVWFVQADESLRLRRLVQRHVDHGKSADEAHRWATASDQANAELVARTRPAADLLVEIDVARPTYDRSKVRGGIVHFGVGGFHRAHQAMYVDALMNDGTALDWGITGVGLLPGDRRMHEVMQAQDCLFTLVVKDADGTMHPRVIGSIVDYLFAPDDAETVLQRLAAPSTRIVSLTITEGGYHVNQATGEFDADDPSIQHDLQPGAVPSTAFGYVTEALARRRADDVEPFTVMSCDNIQGNGEVAHKMIGAFARLKDPDLAGWIEEHVTFPNSMVDRITPVTTDHDRSLLAERFAIDDGWPVVCEPFTQWVLEDRFPSGRPPFERVGVQLVPDVGPYELMKLRLLNASHQAMCYLGYLSGYRYAHEVCSDPLFTGFLLGYMDDEATPTLDPVPGVDLTAYKHQLIERFANPEIRDTLARLCAESSDRIPKWLLPVVRHQLSVGGPVRRSALVVAAWARYAEAVDESGNAIDVVDRRKEALLERAGAQAEDELAFLRDPDLFGDLVDDERFTTEYAAALRSLHEHGARATLEQWEKS